MSESILKEIQKAIESIRFGSIEIVVHDSKIVQIERKEKIRIHNNPLTGQPEV